MTQDRNNDDKKDQDYSQYDDSVLLAIGQRYIKDIVTKATNRDVLEQKLVYPNDKIIDYMNDFSRPEANTDEITSAEKYRLFAGKQTQEGDDKTSASFNNLADSLEAALKFLGSMDFNKDDQNQNHEA